MLETINIPQSVRNCIASLHQQYVAILADNLLGVYIHGSIAMGCFNPNSSDIDVLVIVGSPLSLETKQQLGRVHIQLADACPNAFELSVVLRSELLEFAYPTPFEFHYGDDHIDKFRDGSIDLTTPRKDPDLAAHFVITKQYGITLQGESAQQIFPDVPDSAYLDSIAGDAKWSYDRIKAGPDEGDCRVPVYGVVNFCRVLAFIEEGRITSKRTGAEWALTHLPDTYHPVIQAALNEYIESGTAPPVSCQLLKAFAEYAYERIRAHQQT